ncbi:RNA polymerase sigma-54 factor [Anaerofustis stercorihominis]|nr:RNA polymerase sigma-54 factor [Anaerofustis stercorihominis]
MLLFHNEGLMDIKQEHNISQVQTLSQAQVMSLNILSMDSLELNEFLYKEYLENPLLENKCENNRDITLDIKNMDIPSKRQHSKDDIKYLETPNTDEINIKHYILYQLNYDDYSKNDLVIMEFLIDCLDNNGYFNYELTEISEISDYNIGDIEKCINVLKNLQPYGIFSKDLKECLLIQLKKNNIFDENISNIVINYLNEVSENNVSKISKELNISRLEVRKYIYSIKCLNPKPLINIKMSEPVYINPDILLTYENNKWNIELNDNWINNYYISDYYLKMIDTSEDENLKMYFKEKLSKCRFILNSLEQRRNTILNITKVIIRRQEKYFRGNGKIVSMTLSEVADEIDMNVSTVSRAIKNKYMSSPIGIINMRDLFSSYVSYGEDIRLTPEDVKQKIKVIIEEENKKKPYSDDEIVNKLNDENINISRRTVSKYRKELNIPTSYNRKE